MKRSSQLLLLLLLCAAAGIVSAQNTGDYQTHQSGSWNDVNTWEKYNGSTWDYPSADTPDSNSVGVTTILNGHNVTVNANVAVDQVTVGIGGIVTVNCSVATLTIGTGGMTVNGTLTITGNVPTAAPYNVVIVSGANLTIAGTGIVNINETAAATGTKGFLPSATWQNGSNLNINSFGGATATGWGAGGGQNFSNINYAVTSTASFGWGFTASTLSGNLTVTSTGSGRLQLFGGSSGTLNINGDIIISGSSNFTLNGTSSATDDTVNVYGNVNVNSTGNFSISRGSQGSAGTSICNFYGESISIANITTQNSNTKGFGASVGAKFVFKKGSTQYFSMSSVTFSSPGTNFEITNGSTIQLISSVSFQSPSNSNIILTDGKIVTSSSNLLTLSANDSLFNGSSSCFVDGPLAQTWGASTATKMYPLGDGSDYRPLEISLTTPASPVIRAEVFNGNAGGTSSLDAISTVRYVQTSLISGSATSGGTVKLNYDADDGVSDFSTLVVAQSSTVNGTYSTMGNSASDASSVTSGTSYNPASGDFLLIGSNGSNPLPVEIKSLTATVDRKSIFLLWNTATEVNNAGFEIERRISKNEWSKIGFVEGNGTSNAAHSYSYTDKALSPETYQYRLKQIDRDGKFEYSTSIEAIVAMTADDYKLSQNYPNPFNPTTTFTFAFGSAEHASVKVYNIVGQEVATLFNGIVQADQLYSMTFNAKDLPSGIYFYTLHSQSKNEVKKMMLMK